MSPADQLRSRADEIDHEAECVRWTEPRTARHLTAIAHELRDIAQHLPPPERATDEGEMP